MEHAAAGRSPRNLSRGIRIALVVCGLLMVFGVVLVAELVAGRSSQTGSELVTAPSRLLPARLAGYDLRAQPQLAASLADAYRRTLPQISSVEAAEIGLRGTAASAVGARVGSDSVTTSPKFRAGVLSGAASGFEVDTVTHPFVYLIRRNVAIYSAETPEGRLYVWFFRNAFVQLFVPAAIVTEGDAMQRELLDSQLG